MQHRKTYNYFNFQQNWVSRSVKTVHTNVFTKIISYIDLQIPIVFSRNHLFQQASSYNVHVHVYQFLAKSSLYRAVKSMHTKLFAKNRKLHNLQLPILISKKSIISDMHHRAMYMYINFQQNQVSRSVKTVHTNLFANNHKLH